MTCIGANLASHKFGFLPHIRLASLKIKPPSLSGEIREHESRTSLRLFVTLQEVRQPEDCRARGGYSLFHTSFGPCTNSARVRQRAELRHSDRKSVVLGKSVSVSVDSGVRLTLK